MKLTSMFAYISQDLPCFQFTKKLNNWNLKRLIVRLWLFAGGLCSFVRDLWSFAVVRWWFVVVCGALWSLSVLATTIVIAFETTKCFHVLKKKEQFSNLAWLQNRIE